MTSGRWRKDRRTGYSFRAHVRRIVESKGLTRTALTLGATAVIAGTAFANCSSSDISGPSSDEGARATTDVVSPTSEPSTVTTTTTTATSSPQKTGPVKLFFAALPPKNPCTNDDILWDRQKSMLAITTQTSTGTDGRMHVQFHFNSQAHGTAALRPVHYTGSQEYNSQTFTYLPEAGNENYMKFEWNMKMVAKGESGPLGEETLLEGDDFFLHIVAYPGEPPTFVPVPEGVSVEGRPSDCR